MEFVFFMYVGIGAEITHCKRYTQFVGYHTCDYLQPREYFLHHFYVMEHLHILISQENWNLVVCRIDGCMLYMFHMNKESPNF